MHLGKPLPRRTFLRGLGTVVALPLLDAMIPAFSRAATTPKAPCRMAFVYVPNGVIMDAGRPTPKARLRRFQRCCHESSNPWPPIATI